ncbi:MAG: hypothetical protein KDA79_04440 [Planctomycetaceae bacterium]|nr:hypothetical protein [Planctomycetaceae bacterium]
MLCTAVLFIAGSTPAEAGEPQAAEAAATSVRSGEATASGNAAAVEDSLQPQPLVSGRTTGEYIPQFYSRVVTGPLMNRSVCFVCRNGQRPVVMVLVRQLEPGLKPLLRNIDRLVDRNRTTGLRSFGVHLSNDPFRSISQVQTFSFTNRIQMPLTVSTDAVASESCQNLHPEAAVTVVLYQRRRVIERFAFRENELTFDRVREVIQAVKQFAADELQPAEADPAPAADSAPVAAQKPEPSSLTAAGGS